MVLRVIMKHTKWSALPDTNVMGSENRTLLCFRLLGINFLISMTSNAKLICCISTWVLNLYFLYTVLYYISVYTVLKIKYSGASDRLLTRVFLVTHFQLSGNFIKSRQIYFSSFVAQRITMKSVPKTNRCWAME